MVEFFIHHEDVRRGAERAFSSEQQQRPEAEVLKKAREGADNKLDVDRAAQDWHLLVLGIKQRRQEGEEPSAEAWAALAEGARLYHEMEPRKTARPPDPPPSDENEGEDGGGPTVTSPAEGGALSGAAQGGGQPEQPEALPKFVAAQEPPRRSPSSSTWPSPIPPTTPTPRRPSATPAPSSSPWPA